MCRHNSFEIVKQYIQKSFRIEKTSKNTTHPPPIIQDRQDTLAAEVPPNLQPSREGATNNSQLGFLD